ncbi:MAG TPA: hypothetical protein VF834_10450 [Streptosporangiaceae bacterium]
MHLTIGRRARLTVLGAGLITAAAVALSATGPALADTTDTGGTATITIPRSYIVHLAKSGVVLLAGAPSTSSYTAGPGNFSSTDAYTLPVTGGNGEVSNFYGTVDLGGTLVVISAAHSQTATITDLKINFFNGTLTGVIDGAARPVTIAYISGNLSSSTGTGTETFTATQLAFGARAAAALNTALGTTVFARATNLGSLSTTYDVTVS